MHAHAHPHRVPARALSCQGPTRASSSQETPRKPPENVNQFRQELLSFLAINPRSCGPKTGWDGDAPARGSRTATAPAAPLTTSQRPPAPPSRSLLQGPSDLFAPPPACVSNPFSTSGPALAVGRASAFSPSRVCLSFSPGHSLPAVSLSLYFLPLFGICLSLPGKAAGPPAAP